MQIYLYIFLNSLHRFDGGLAVGEGGETDKSFSATTETDSGCGDHLAMIEQMVEEGPGVPSMRRATPYIRCILSAVHLHTYRSQAVQDEGSGLFVIRQVFADTFLSFRRESSLRGALGDISGTVVFGTLPAHP